MALMKIVKHTFAIDSASHEKQHNLSLHSLLFGCLFFWNVLQGELVGSHNKSR
jgi:hypothetical protein